jgi:hypothetical protein
MASVPADSRGIEEGFGVSEVKRRSRPSHSPASVLARRAEGETRSPAPFFNQILNSDAVERPDVLLDANYVGE